MRLGIITDCTHYKTPDGKIATENHILLRQFKALGAYYPQIFIACPFGEYSPEKVLSYYNDSQFTFYELPLVGGKTLKEKWQLIATIPKWMKAFHAVDRNSDIVYQRFPNNLNIPGFLYFRLKGKSTFATYTGTWANFLHEPWTYRLQKWLLANWFKGPVWVYAEQKQQNSRLIEGFSPSYSQEEWEEETHQVNERVDRIRKEGISTLKLITVGSLVPNKNQSAIIKACAILKNKEVPFQLTIVGGGYLFADLKKLILNLDLQNEVKLAGKKTAEELRELYRQHDFVVQAPIEEGYGKVPIEGFFHGLIPILNKKSLAFLITGNGERGFLFDASNCNELAELLAQLKNRAQNFPQMIEAGRQYAKSHTLKAWASEYYEQVSGFYKK